MLELGSNVLDKCTERGDEWGVQVKGRLEGYNDLVAEEALYHKVCHPRFMHGLSPDLGETYSGQILCTAVINAGHIQCLVRMKMSDICKEVATSIVPYHK